MGSLKIINYINMVSSARAENLNFGHVQNSLDFPHNVLQRGNNVVQRGSPRLQRTKNVTESKYNECMTLCYVSATLWYVVICCGTL